MHPDPDTHHALLAASRITVSAPLRGYEMSQDGCLAPSGFARFFELMRWELGQRGRVRDPAMPKRGVVRAQTHRYLAELRFPDTWTGRTHLVHVGGSSLHYAHDVVRADGVRAIEARTVIVLLDDTGRPAQVPEYLRDYVDQELRPPPPLGAPEPTWADQATYRVTARPSDQDSFGHVNQARYVDFVDDARRALGLGPLRALSVAYERETLAGDVLAISFQRVGEGLHAYRMLRESDGVVVNRGVLEA